MSWPGGAESAHRSHLVSASYHAVRAGRPRRWSAEFLGDKPCAPRSSTAALSGTMPATARWCPAITKDLKRGEQG
jgi:hypothetical protein